MPALMIQGCGSDVGKSTIVAGLCRAFANRGFEVRPFKPQNMSNNAAVTADGGEIGRAQAVQARACRTPPCVDMNPVLLKPQSDTGAQLVLRGRMAGQWSAAQFRADRGRLLDLAVNSFRRLEAESELVLVEGAGSPAEVNLRAGDIANMGFARATNVPVVLVGDIDRGHVIAALVGTRAVLDAADCAMIRGFIVNKFRGDPALFDDGRREIVARTGWADLGLVPWLAAARRLPAEDAVVLDRLPAAATGKHVKVVVPLLPRIANFDDFDPLRRQATIDFAFIPPGTALPGDADLVIVPGTKATLADLAFLRAQGWDIDIAAHARRGGRVLGICGGYQMLGMKVSDVDGVEGPPAEAAGLGLLDVNTVLTRQKRLTATEGRLAGGAPFEGYEIHAGETSGRDAQRAWICDTGGRTLGAASADHRIRGTYVHGLFDKTAARMALMAELGAASEGTDQDRFVDAALDEIADALERALDIAALQRLAGL
jgi:adenosylcobyric acid synthase